MHAGSMDEKGGGSAHNVHCVKPDMVRCLSDSSPSLSSSSCWRTSSCWPGWAWLRSPPCPSSCTSTSGPSARTLPLSRGPTCAWIYANSVYPVPLWGLMHRLFLIWKFYGKWISLSINLSSNSVMRSAFSRLSFLVQLRVSEMHLGSLCDHFLVLN